MIKQASCDDSFFESSALMLQNIALATRFSLEGITDTGCEIKISFINEGDVD